MQHPDSHSMSMHLSAERLAAFDHEPFTVEELAHLAGCASCRAEREAMGALVSLARTHGRPPVAEQAPRLVSWEAIAAGLRQAPGNDLADASAHVHAGSVGVADAVADAGVSAVAAPSLMAGPVANAGPRAMPYAAPQATRSRWGTAALRRAAAAVLLLSGGALLGRLTADRGVGDAVAQVAVGNALGDSEFTSVERATEVLTRAQRDYERASMWLASNDTTVRSSDVYRARLAALDQMMAASRAALRDAPQDPVLNHYYLAAYSAREATLQALGGILPVDKVIERY